jgi:Fe-S cluster assembly iron-binding protein IscA
MSLDEPKRFDAVLTEQSIMFAIDKDLLEEVKPVRIDFIEAGGQSGFLLTPRDELPSMSALQEFN